MIVELICVGSELLSGDVVNTNASYISKRLRELGHDSFRQFTVDDNKARLSELIGQSYERCDVLILTGGLGPTADDITKETLCETLGIELVENDICRRHIDSFFKNLGRVPTENNYRQATAPKGARIFPNDRGTACGYCIEQGEKRVIMLPGPPRELSHMFDAYVVPYLKTLNHHAIVTHTLNVFGLGESLIETVIKPFCENDNPSVATYCGNNECTVKITATADTETEAEAICSKTILQIRELLGDYIYGADSQGLASEVVNSLRVSGLKISTAESCTGGMLSQSLTSISHSSEVVEIGILAYSNRIKHEALSVPRDVLEECGAISPETAMYLAKNVRILSDSDIGVGITGNAGPSASENKPVGLVYVAIADKTKFYVRKLQLPSTYDREKIRSYATLTALDLVRRYVAARPFAMQGMIGYDEPFGFDEGNQPELEFAVNTKAEPVADKAGKFNPNMNFIVFEPDDYDETDAADIPEVSAETTDDMSDTESAATPAESTDASSGKKGFFAGLKEKLKKLALRVFPTRNDKAQSIIIKTVSIIALIGLVVSSVALIAHFAEESTQRSIIDSAREEFKFDSEDKNEDTKQYSVFDSLIAQNPDVKAWLSITNTNVDNPVYQTDDNDYYLKHNMLGEKSRYGALFFDCNDVIASDGNSKNLTIYGHNMKDKSMFGSLSNYRSLKFYKRNPTIALKTLYDQYEYAIFAVMITNASPDDDNGYLYNYTRAEFSSEEDFLSWIAEAQERSLINTGITITGSDEILTLSTCCYDFNDARFVIMAKKIRPGDTLPASSSATLNSNVRYPQAWYDKKGLEGYKKAGTESEGSASEGTTSSEVIPSSGTDTSSNVSTSSGSSSSVSSSTSSGTSSSTGASSSAGSSSSAASSSAASSSTAACAHEASGTPVAEGGNHTYTCAKCKAKVTVAHSFTQSVVESDYLVSAASCTSPAVYKKSCVCGAASTQTFQHGSKLEHSPSTDWKHDTTQHWHICENQNCNEKLNVSDHVESGMCECGYNTSTATEGQPAA